MKRRFASSVLLLIMAGSAFAGMPLHFGESECTMSGMMDMDCCKAALMHQETPEIANAKLCCALNCAQNGTTSPPGKVRVTQPSPTPLILHPAMMRLFTAPSSPFPRLNRFHGPPGPTPTYLRNLVLLI
jgi:hypothetical protein